MYFKKRSYSDLEIQEILETLFNEKKKVTALELQLKNSTLSPPLSKPSIDPDLIKEVSWHKGHIKQLEEELSALYKQLSSAREEIERVSYLDKTEGAQREEKYQGSLRTLQRNLEQVEANNHTLLSRLSLADETIKRGEENLQRALDEAALLKEEVGAIKRDKEDLEAEEHALKEQFETIKMQYMALQKSLQPIEAAKKQAEALSKERLAAFNASQKELELFTQMMTKTHETLKEEKRKEEENYHKQIATLKEEALSVKAKHSNSDLTVKAIQEDLAKTKELFNQSQEALIQATEKIKGQEVAEKELELFAKELKVRTEKAEETLKELEESQKTQLAESHAQKIELDEALLKIRQAEADKHERESEFRMAQQHLAKKVREAATLSEKSEELKRRTQELELALEATKAKNYELQAQQIASEAHMQKIEQHAKEAVKAASLQSAKWEEKYYELKEKLDTAEAKNRELKKLEERFGKLHVALSQISQIMISPFNLQEGEELMAFHPNAIESVSSARQFTVATAQEQEPLPSPSQSSLFEPLQQAPKFKESLFG